MTVKLARPEDWITLSKLVKEVLPAWQALKQGVRLCCFTHVEQGTHNHYTSAHTITTATG
jgi:hypothetical protein